MNKTAPLPAGRVTAKIPIPDNIVPGGRKQKYPFSRMKPGDSFWLPLRNGESAKAKMAAIMSAALYWRKKEAQLEPRKSLESQGAVPEDLHQFAVEPEKVKGKNGIRVWMVQ